MTIEEAKGTLRGAAMRLGQEASTEALIHWIEERFENCVRISLTKTGSERDGWVEDALWFCLVREALARLAQVEGGGPKG